MQSKLMIESSEGVKNIDEILQVPGIDAVHIGASDLGVSLGIGPPSPGNSRGTEAAVQNVLKACLARESPAAIQRCSAERPKGTRRRRR